MKEILEIIKKDNSGKEFWIEINKKRKGREGISDNISMDEWIKHFSEAKRNENIITAKASKENTYEIRKEKENEIIIKINDIEKAINKLKKKKAAGIDGITNEAWIIGKDLIKNELEIIYKELWSKKKIPDEWEECLIVPIFKKGDKDNVKNYRGVSIVDTGYKIYAEIIQKKLEEEIEKKSF